MRESELHAYSRLAGGALAEPRSGSVAWWGMVLAVVTEALLFASLIAAYFYLRWYYEGTWPPSGEDPEVLRPALFTAALVASSGSLALGQLGIRRGATPLLATGLAITILFGLTFVGLQAWDYVEKVDGGIVPSADVHASLTYVLTGAHAAHVLIGLVVLAWVLARSLTGAYTAERRLGVSVAAIYWHFVVAVAVVVFLTTVISPYV